MLVFKVVISHTNFTADHNPPQYVFTSDQELFEKLDEILNECN